MIEGMADGGVKQGLPRDLSYKLAAYTFMGAAKMVLETGEHPAILKESVQSPGGSTVYGMHELEKGGMRGLLINAVEAASERSRATGRELLPRSPTDEDEEDQSNDDSNQKSKIKDNKPTIKKSR
ncbi:pyrroline-5-carboxylate reductase dimerization domain-containing protein [Ditylenchus destructor]|uniref:Pyrroline-5-carboxylate reductase dimerization domain-containing protein n=1 Tax=Ditylenchus destructor TaxID=166010 RepID=A0AAD4MQ95_9BILA|nr:pyrroline-5-carboxylate reductase dimerization domain-containing protein [Ditylenchus destructor]